MDADEMEAYMSGFAGPFTFQQYLKHLEITLQSCGISGLLVQFNELRKLFPESQILDLTSLVESMIVVWYMIVAVPDLNNDNCAKIMRGIRDYLICSRYVIISNVERWESDILDAKAYDAERCKMVATSGCPDIADKIKIVADAAIDLGRTANADQQAQLLSLINTVFNRMIDYAGIYMTAPAAAPKATNEATAFAATNNYDKAVAFAATLYEPPGCTCSTCAESDCDDDSEEFDCGYRE